MGRSLRLAVVAAMSTSLLVLSGCSQLSAAGAPVPQASATEPVVSSSPSATPESLEPTTSATPSTDTTSATPTSAAPSASSSEPTAQPSTTAPAAEVVLAPGATGDQVRELQARLAQINWYEGTITPTYDEKTKDAVAGFQGKRAITATGVVDKTTWSALTEMTRQPTSDEMNNVMRPGPALLKAGSTGDQVRDLQVRLRQLSWYSGPVSGAFDEKTVAGVRGFQGKRAIPVTGEVDQRTLDRLVSMTRKPTTQEKNNVAPSPAAGVVLDERCRSGRVLCVDKTSRTLRWVIDGQVQRTFAVRFGSSRTPTREGQFSVNSKSRDHVSTLYDTPMPYALFFSGGQAIHYSADFAARGYSGASHGCVNVRDKAGIAWLFDQVRVGDTVIVYRG